MTPIPSIAWQHGYAALPAQFWQDAPPTPVAPPVAAEGEAGHAEAEGEHAGGEAGHAEGGEAAESAVEGVVELTAAQVEAAGISIVSVVGGGGGETRGADATGHECTNAASSS